MTAEGRIKVNVVGDAVPFENGDKVLAQGDEAIYIGPDWGTDGQRYVANHVVLLCNADSETAYRTVPFAHIDHSCAPANSENRLLEPAFGISEAWPTCIIAESGATVIVNVGASDE